MIDLIDFSDQVNYHINNILIKKASRPISTDQLNALLHVHPPPINLVVSEESLGARRPSEI